MGKKKFPAHEVLRMEIAPATHGIVLAGEERTVRCHDGQDVLNAVVAAGVRRMMVGCRGGGCGVCRVIVRSGTYETGRMSKRHVTSADAATVFALACRLYPTSDLEIEYAPVTRSTVEPPKIGSFHVDR